MEPGVLCHLMVARSSSSLTGMAPGCFVSVTGIAKTFSGLAFLVTRGRYSPQNTPFRRQNEDVSLHKNSSKSAKSAIYQQKKCRFAAAMAVSKKSATWRQKRGGSNAPKDPCLQEAPTPVTRMVKTNTPTGVKKESVSAFFQRFRTEKDL